MIIDLRTRAPIPHGDHDRENQSADFTQTMECVDVSVVVADHCQRLGITCNNDEIAEFVSRAPEKRIGFAAIDPMLDSSCDDLAKVIGQGFSGITLCPADQGYRPTHANAFEIFQKCSEARLPVLVANPRIRHPGSSLEYVSPALLDEIVRELPELTIILGDFGKIFLEETLVMIAKHQRVFAEISGAVNRPWTLYTAMIAAHERGVLHKLLFGSGYPDESPEAAIERIYTINSMRGGTELPSVPRESLRSIVERNALACIGVKAPAEQHGTDDSAGAPRLAAGAKAE